MEGGRVTTSIVRAAIVRPANDPLWARVGGIAAWELRVGVKFRVAAFRASLLSRLSCPCRFVTCHAIPHRVLSRRVSVMLCRVVSYVRTDGTCPLSPPTRSDNRVAEQQRQQ